jgi:alpha-L-fucosidase 2
LPEAGLALLDYQWERLPVYRRFAREFYGVDGAVVPGVATLAGNPTGGWSQYAFSPTGGLWVGHLFYRHWRFFMDHRFLAQRAYPWLKEIASGVVHLLESRNGRLYLPLSSAPEIHDNTLAAWLTPNSNYDLALMHWTFDALTEMAEALH